MANGRRIILPTESETTAVLTAPIGDHLVRKMIQVYEGSFAEGIAPSAVVMASDKSTLI